MSFKIIIQKIQKWLGIINLAEKIELGAIDVKEGKGTFFLSVIYLHNIKQFKDTSIIDDDTEPLVLDFLRKVITLRQNVH